LTARCVLGHTAWSIWSTVGFTISSLTLCYEKPGHIHSSCSTKPHIRVVKTHTQRFVMGLEYKSR
jgi:hypothetical protein